MYSLTYAGIIVALGGTFLVNQLGITQDCSTELMQKLVENAPLIIGSIMSLIGRYRVGGVNVLGFKK